MSGTPTIVTSILNRLTGDASLTATLTGGIYDRPIKREGDGSTPDAFADTRPYQPRPAAVVTDGTDGADLLGPNGSYQSFPWVYLYAPPHQSGKNTIADAWDQMHSLLHNWRLPTANNTDALVTVIGRLGVMDDPEMPDRVLGGMRLQVTGLWRRLD